MSRSSLTNWPKCRFCATIVENYGDLCSQCDAVTERDELGRPIPNGTMELTRAATERTLERMDAESV